MGDGVVRAGVVEPSGVGKGRDAGDNVTLVFCAESEP